MLERLLRKILGVLCIFIGARIMDMGIFYNPMWSTVSFGVKIIIMIKSFIFAFIPIIGGVGLIEKR